MLLRSFVTCLHPFASQIELAEKSRNHKGFAGYRLCVLASGSSIMVISNCRMRMRVSCFHFGQNKGKFSSTVSFLICRRVLLLQKGQYIHRFSSKTTTFSLYVTTIVFPALRERVLIWCSFTPRFYTTIFLTRIGKTAQCTECIQAYNTLHCIGVRICDGAIYQ